jgi:HEPN domain-containing protein
MKDRRDLVLGWLSKADSDLTVLELALSAESALDTACFHAQQAAEKLLKAFLLDRQVAFPFTHDLPRLLLLCQAQDASFAVLLRFAELLTPYALELRYDDDFWPSLEVTREARDAALAIRRFVLQRLPPDLADELSRANP